MILTELWKDYSYTDIFFKYFFYISELTEEESYSFKIVFQCELGRTYYLCTDAQRSMEAWMKALACASYDYMKLMVAELQRQLDEAQGEIRYNENSKNITFSMQGLN